MFQIFLGAMDKESVRVVGGNKKGIIDASTLVYKYVFAAGAAADDFLSRGDLMRMVAAWDAVVKHFHEMPIEWIFSVGNKVLKLPISQFNRASQLYFLIDICSLDMVWALYKRRARNMEVWGWEPLQMVQIAT